MPFSQERCGARRGMSVDQKPRQYAWALAYVPGSTAPLVHLAQGQETNGDGHNADADEKHDTRGPDGEC
jgi:hypothetical protein